MVLWTWRYLLFKPMNLGSNSCNIQRTHFLCAQTGEALGGMGRGHKRMWGMQKGGAHAAPPTRDMGRKQGFGRLRDWRTLWHKGVSEDQGCAGKGG